jgi:outer membrane protein assembly factor BamB
VEALAASGDRLLVASPDGALSAYRLPDGAPLWTSRPASFQRLAAAAGLGYFVSTGWITAFDLDDGHLLFSLPSLLDCASACSLEVDGNLLVVGNREWMEVRDAEGGALLRRPVVVHGPIAVAGGTVYAASDKGVRAIDLASGRTRWRHASPSGFQALAADVDAVYVRRNDGALVALDRATGRTQFMWDSCWVSVVFDGERGAIVFQGLYSGYLDAFSRDQRARPVEHALVAGRVTSYDELPDEILVGEALVPVDRRGRFRTRVSGRGRVPISGLHLIVQPIVGEPTVELGERRSYRIEVDAWFDETP